MSGFFPTNSVQDQIKWLKRRIECCCENCEGDDSADGVLSNITTDGRDIVFTTTTGEVRVGVDVFSSWLLSTSILLAPSPPLTSLNLRDFHSEVSTRFSEVGAIAKITNDAVIEMNPASLTIIPLPTLLQNDYINSVDEDGTGFEINVDGNYRITLESGDINSSGVSSVSNKVTLDVNGTIYNLQTTYLQNSGVESTSFTSSVNFSASAEDIIRLRTERVTGSAATSATVNAGDLKLSIVRIR